MRTVGWAASTPAAGNTVVARAEAQAAEPIRTPKRRRLSGCGKAIPRIGLNFAPPWRQRVPGSFLPGLGFLEATWAKAAAGPGLPGRVSGTAAAVTTGSIAPRSALAGTAAENCGPPR